ncbi:hypothetical protein A3F19_01745 [Candidatus Nomurabacteria bacterium RIFCSPHIGHO2_12_FULL_37_29]|uniref:Methyltransferase type 11 domain-containing protein n=1 Tax=Candidatus Nomurabacteria bacterium RIFCSPHIGHO2_12_FULL_37_29 TaxID=1801759 RepID=A0A1F6WAG7_9BACT|nr:MAG: hypothetical protein A3F19_01745 [Candidatus Nomurabacteria bacterium RIFCSPHIGHO2_12_FULL_37_29]
MKSPSIKAVLDQSFNDLAPFSFRYTHEKRRYIHTLKIIRNLVSDGTKILDIGTGAGITPLCLKRMGFDAEGLEYFIFPKNKTSRFATRVFEKSKELKKRWQELGLVVHEKNVLTDNLTPLGSFDVIVSEALIEHLKNPKLFLKRTVGLLKEGGLLVIATPNQVTLMNRIRLIFGKSIYWPINEFFSDGEDFIGHWREYTQSELEYMVKESGFEIIQSDNINLLRHFRKIEFSLKNLRALIYLISNLIPGTRDMNYITARKK